LTLSLLVDAIDKHKNVYKDEGGNHDENSLGTAAAMQALKMFNQGEGKQSGGGGQGAFLSLAMGEASKVRCIHLSLQTQIREKKVKA
jgi:hypothetical protein